MSRVRKGKKRLDLIKTIIIIAIIIIALVVLVIKVISKNKANGNDNVIDSQNIEEFNLPDTEYNSMEVTNVEMAYLVESNETNITMTIYNTTSESIEKRAVTATLLDPSGEQIGETTTWIETLGPGEEVNLSIVLQGDRTATSEIRLTD